MHPSDPIGRSTPSLPAPAFAPAPFRPHVSSLQVSLKLGEQSRRRNWWSVTSYVPSYRVKVCDLSIKAKVGGSGETNHQVSNQARVFVFVGAFSVYWWCRDRLLSGGWEQRLAQEEIV